MTGPDLSGPGGFPPEEWNAIRDYLKVSYHRVFSPAMVDAHLEQHVGTGESEAFADFLAREGAVGRDHLDVGSGFGSLVVSGRARGIKSVGVEVSPVEVDFARRRLARACPGTDPAALFHQGSGLALAFPDAAFDRVTLLNVLEHTPDAKTMLAEALRVLRPGGRLYVVCPNYASFRREAHYHVFWPPLLPRRAARAYLRLRGRDPAFFDKHIFYRTPWGVRRALGSAPVRVESLTTRRLAHPGLWAHRPWVARALGNPWGAAFLRGAARLWAWNPLARGVGLCVWKDDRAN